MAQSVRCCLHCSLSAPHGYLLRGSGLWLPCTGRVLAEVAKGSLQPPVKLLATRHGTAAAAVGKTFGALGLGFSVGNAIGGRLSTGGLTAPLGLASLCATANILLVAACLPHVDPAAAVTAYPEPSSSTMTTQLAEEPRRGGDRASLLSLLSTWRVLRLLFVRLAVGASFFLFTGTWDTLMRQRFGYTSLEQGYLLALVRWAFGVSNLLLVQRLSRRRLLHAALGLIALVCAA